MTEYIPERPSDEPVVISRGALEVLAKAGLTATAWRVVIVLLARHDPDEGVTNLAQEQIAALAETSRPTVAHAIKALRDRNIIIDTAYCSYTLNPALTGKATIGPLRNVPPITAPGREQAPPSHAESPVINAPGRSHLRSA